MPYVIAYLYWLYSNLDDETLANFVPDKYNKLKVQVRKCLSKIMTVVSKTTE